MNYRGPIVGVALIAVLTHVSLGAPAQTDPREHGRILATNGTDGVAPCATCHGADGNGMAASGTPRLAGMEQPYLEKQLRDYAAGTRNQAVMQPMAKRLSEEQIRAAAAYYASLPPGRQRPAATAEERRKGESLAIYGDWQRDIPSCVRCHGPGGQGLGVDFPEIAAQPESYIAAQLKAWRSGERTNDPGSLMKVVAERLSDEDIRVVAAYFAELPASSSKKGGSR